MSYKYVHFIRHGQTSANKARRHQGPNETLSKEGVEQAKAVAEVLSEFNIDTLLSSDFTRARDTAVEIGKKLDLPMTLVKEVVEFRRPASIYGRSHFSLGSLLYVMRLFLHQGNPDWDDDGAENLFHIHQRMHSAKRIVEETDGEHIVVVSHAIFMDMFTQMVCADRDISLIEFIKGVILTKKIPNTGMVTFTIDMDAPGQTCKWWFHGFGLESARDAHKIS